MKIRTALAAALFALVSHVTLAAAPALHVGDGGTGASDPADARANLGAAALGRNNDVTSLAKIGIYSILESGAQCTAANALSMTPTDEGSEIATWWNTLAAGSRVEIPASAFCYFNAADLVIPLGITVEGAGHWQSNPNQGALFQGGGFVHGAGVRLVLNEGVTVSHFGIWRGPQDGFFHGDTVNFPTVAQTQSDIYQWYGGEYSEGINGGPFGMATIRDLAVVGFHVCVALENAHFDIDGLDTDCPTSFAAYAAGDINFIRRVRNEPWYSLKVNNAMNSGIQRWGTCFYLGATVNLSDAQCEGFPMGIVVVNSGDIRVDNVGQEYCGCGNQSEFEPAEWGSMFIHVWPGGDQNFFDRVHFSATNNSSVPGSPGVGIPCDGVVIEAGYGGGSHWRMVDVNGITGGCYTFYAAGGANNPLPILNIGTVAPAAGKVITIQFGGSSISAVGGPYTITYTVTHYDNLTEIVRHLIYLINTQYAALAHAHIMAEPTYTVGGSSPNENTSQGQIFINYPADETVTITVTVDGQVKTNGADAAGINFAAASGTLDSFDISWGNSLGGMFLGNSVSGAGQWNISNVFANLSTQALPPYWLNWTVPPAQIRLSGVQWSKGYSNHLTGAGSSLGANSYDDNMTITVGANSTATYMFETPWPGGQDPDCEISGAPYNQATFSATTLTIENTTLIPQTYKIRCGVHP